jgi:Ni,Fe-hydrogenase I large subunit
MENELDLRLQKLELSLQANLEKRIEAMQLEVKTAGEAQTRAIAEVKQRQDSDQTVLTTMQKLLEQVAQTQMAQQQDSQAIKQTLEKVANTMASPAAKANGDGAEGRSRSPKGR